MLIHMDQTNRETKQTDQVTTGTQGHAAKTSGSINQMNRGCELDLTGAMRDQDAYKTHSRSMDEVMKQAQAKDVTVQKKYMTVMSHSMSGEDFAKLMEEGYRPEDIEPEELVTIVDRIKAELVRAGVVVSGYNDDLDQETLEQITGSTTMANELRQTFAQADIPLTKENVQQTAEAWDKIAQLEEVSPQLAAYLLQNHLQITPDELYLARHAVTTKNMAQPGYTGGGYYREDIRGYYGQQASMKDLDAIMTQVDQVIIQAGFPLENQTKADALWMVEQSIPLTAESFRKMQQIKEALPIEYESFVKACAASIAQGGTPGQAKLNQKETIYEQAYRIYEETCELTPQAAEYAARNGDKPLTLEKIREADQNLIWKQTTQRSAGQTLDALRARTQLEQVRLLMTAEVNLKLLRSGFQIETAPMEQLIDELKSAAEELSQTLFGTNKTNDMTSASPTALERETGDTLAAIVDGPVAALGKFHVQDADFTLRKLREQSDVMRAGYEQAGEHYETMMTKVRNDLGDSIRKAFRNTDAILEDMDLPLTEDNRRAVRILGYNSMDITSENMDRVKAVDLAVREALRKLTPATALQMIREGEDPLSMNVGQLNDYLDEHASFDEKAEKYSRFLYKLEQKGDITEQERESYIELYRFVRQLEKNDGAAIGAVVHMGAELTFGNLRTAMRSERAVGSFGTNHEDYAGHVVHRLATELATHKLPEQVWEETESLEAFEDRVREGGEEDDTEYRREQYREFTRLMKQLEPEQNTLVSQLEQNHLPVTVSMMEILHSFRKNPLVKDEKIADTINETWKDCIESFTDEQNAKEAFQKAAEGTKQTVEQMLDETAGSKLDVRMLQLVHRQFTTIAHLAGQEYYELPMELDGNITLVSVHMLHGEGENAGTIEMSCETRRLGHMSAKVSVSNGRITGDFMTQEEAAYDNLVKWVDSLEKHLQSREYDSVNLNAFRGIRRTEGVPDTTDMTKVSDREMYLLARQILRFL